jgi:hypothetical protein
VKGGMQKDDSGKKRKFKLQVNAINNCKHDTKIRHFQMNLSKLDLNVNMNALSGKNILLFTEDICCDCLAGFCEIFP